MRLWTVRCLVAALCMSWAAATAAELEDQGERLAQTERSSIEYVINQDGSFVENRQWATKVLKAQVLEYAT